MASRAGGKTKALKDKAPKSKKGDDDDEDTAAFKAKQKEEQKAMQAMRAQVFTGTQEGYIAHHPPDMESSIPFSSGGRRMLPAGHMSKRRSRVG